MQIPLTQQCYRFTNSPLLGYSQARHTLKDSCFSAFMTLLKSVFYQLQQKIAHSIKYIRAP